MAPEFFYRTHDPTTLDRQGNDSGTREYVPSTIVFTNLNPHSQSIVRLFSITPSPREIPHRGLPRKSRRNTSTPMQRRSLHRSSRPGNGLTRRTITSFTSSRTRRVINVPHTSSTGDCVCSWSSGQCRVDSRVIYTVYKL